LFIHLFIWIYTVQAISPPFPISPSPSIPTPSFAARTCSALFFDFVEEKTKEIIRKT
jgi:hypothetical protein